MQEFGYIIMMIGDLAIRVPLWLIILSVLCGGFALIRIH